MYTGSMRALLGSVISGNTILRGIIHDVLRQAPELNGSVIDVGGTREPASSYMTVLRVKNITNLTVVNLDPTAHPDILVDASMIPVADASFDAALCFNLLEHVPVPNLIVAEISRVLKPGGICLLETPFLVNVHGYPNDYFRFTSSALEDLVKRSGLVVASTTALGGGPFLAALSIIQPILPRWLILLPLLGAHMLDVCVVWLRPAWVDRWPLGYYVVCKKPI